MAGTAFLSAGTISESKLRKGGPVSLLTAARHCRREIQAELGADGHIEPRRTHLNEVLAGPDSAAGVVALARARMLAAGIDPKGLRRDCVKAVELLISISPDAGVDDGAFFRDCMAWLAARFGEDRILSADVHRDEAAPHMHALLLPLVDGRMVGKELLGGRGKGALAALQAEFHRYVASRHGLKQPGQKPTGTHKAEAVAMVLGHMDPATHGAAWPAIKACVERDPAPFAEALGLALPDAPKKRMRAMCEVFTSAGAGPRREPEPGGKAIAFAGACGQAAGAGIGEVAHACLEADRAEAGEPADGAADDNVTEAKGYLCVSDCPSAPPLCALPCQTHDDQRAGVSGNDSEADGGIDRHESVLLGDGQVDGVHPATGDPQGRAEADSAASSASTAGNGTDRNHDRRAMGLAGRTCARGRAAPRAAGGPIRGGRSPPGDILGSSGARTARAGRSGPRVRRKSGRGAVGGDGNELGFRDSFHGAVALHGARGVGAAMLR